MSAKINLKIFPVTYSLNIGFKSVYPSVWSLSYQNNCFLFMYFVNLFTLFLVVSFLDLWIL